MPTPKKRNIPYWYCLPCTPSLTLPPSSLKCLQKSNPNIHKECFRCFKCFGCFISLLDHKTARFWSKSEQTRKIGTHPPPPYHDYGKHPKRQSTHLPASPHTAVRRAIGAVFFRRSRLFLREAAFFRAARDVSGVRSAPPWARVEIKLKMRFQTLSHSPSHERASALTSPPPDFLFSSIHQKPTKAHKTLHPSKLIPPKPTIPPKNKFVA